MQKIYDLRSRHQTYLVHFLMGTIGSGNNSLFIQRKKWSELFRLDDKYTHFLQTTKTSNIIFVCAQYTGTPFEAVARMQSNLRIFDIADFDQEFGKLANLVLPLFWGEYVSNSVRSNHSAIGVSTSLEKTVRRKANLK